MPTSEPRKLPASGSLPAPAATRASGIRLIAIDLDGTLLDDDKSLPEDNRRALHEAHNAGVLIAIASGRMIRTIEPVERDLGIDTMLIGYNGGAIVGRRADGRPLIAHNPLPAPVAERFIRFSQQRRYLLNFYSDDRLYAENRVEYAELIALYSRRTGAEYQFVEDLREAFRGVAPTKLILLAEAAECTRLLPELQAEFAGAACIARSEPEYLEITAPGIDKASALGLLTGLLNLSAADVMAVGDAENDAAMLRFAGTGVAVANARASVKAAARYVTSRTNGEAGLAEAVRRWALT